MEELADLRNHAGLSVESPRPRRELGECEQSDGDGVPPPPARGALPLASSMLSTIVHRLDPGRVFPAGIMGGAPQGCHRVAGGAAHGTTHQQPAGASEHARSFLDHARLGACTRPRSPVPLGRSPADPPGHRQRHGGLARTHRRQRLGRGRAGICWLGSVVNPSARRRTSGGTEVSLLAPGWRRSWLASSPGPVVPDGQGIAPAVVIPGSIAAATPCSLGGGLLRRHADPSPTGGRRLGGQPRVRRRRAPINQAMAVGRGGTPRPLRLRVVSGVGGSRAPLHHPVETLPCLAKLAGSRPAPVGGCGSVRRQAGAGGPSSRHYPRASR